MNLFQPARVQPFWRNRRTIVFASEIVQGHPHHHNARSRYEEYFFVSQKNSSGRGLRVSPRGAREDEQLPDLISRSILTAQQACIHKVYRTRRIKGNKKGEEWKTSTTKRRRVSSTDTSPSSLVPTRQKIPNARRSDPFRLPDPPHPVLEVGREPGFAIRRPVLFLEDDLDLAISTDLEERLSRTFQIGMVIR